MIELLNKAILLAKSAHKDQKYGAVNPYFVHLEQVAKMASDMGYCDEVICACYLHDIIEDTDISKEYLHKNFPISVVNAVESVTFIEKNPDLKIIQAMQDPIGHVVKFCDSSCNLSNTILNGPLHGKNFGEVVRKYLGNLIILMPALPTPEIINSYLSKQ